MPAWIYRDLRIFQGIELGGNSFFVGWRASVPTEEGTKGIRIHLLASRTSFDISSRQHQAISPHHIRAEASAFITSSYFLHNHLIVRLHLQHG